MLPKKYVNLTNYHLKKYQFLKKKLFQNKNLLKKSKIVIKHIPFNPESLIPPSTTYIQYIADVQPLVAANVQLSTSAANIHSLTTDVHADVQPSTSTAADEQPSTSADADVQPTAAGTVVILDFG